MPWVIVCVAGECPAPGLRAARDRLAVQVGEAVRVLAARRRSVCVCSLAKGALCCLSVACSSCRALRCFCKIPETESVVDVFQV